MSKLIDLTGQDFGFWHVIERAENTKEGRAQWLCLCTKCGKTIKPVQGAHLRSGRSTACTNCRQKKMVAATIKDETGKTYGFLKVIRQATEEEKPRHDRTGIYWNCTCTKCGRENVIVFGDYLRKGETQSCGCISSINESKICQMLDNMNIKYKQQQSFDDLKSKQSNSYNNNLFFDIGVYNEDILIYLIEYDGIQHFEKGHFYDSYTRTHPNDLLKNEYCFKHNIPLIRIPFNVEYTPNDLKLETTRFLLTKEKEEQYYAI